MNPLGAKQKWVVVVLVITMAIFNNCMAEEVELELEEEDDIQDLLGTAIYIPEEDLLGSIPNGINIFKEIPESCMRKFDTATTAKDQTYYKNTEQFYKSIATETNLKPSYEGSFSLGFTLDVTTKQVSGRNRSVSGTSLNLVTKAYELQMVPNCLYETALKERVLQDFDRLNTKISNPHHKVSWTEYQTFLRTHGSHVITGLTFGSNIIQYAFAEKNLEYSARQLTVKACASFGYATMVTISACSGVNKEEINRLTNSKMTTSITVRGGTRNTRHKLIYQRTDELIVKFLDEGHTNPTPIEFTLTPIWQILSKQRGGDNKNRLVQATNLQYYFEGYLNFGCPYIPERVRGPPIQKFDYASHSTATHPVFECTIAPEGCHHPNDCHYHLGVWCACRGDSCIRHGQIKTVAGTMRKTAAQYYENDWQDKGCGWKLWGSSCTCKYESTKRVRIYS